MGLTLTPAPAQLLLREYAPGVSLGEPVSAGTDLFIGGVSFKGQWKPDTFKRDEDLGSTYTASVQLEYYAGALKPQKRQEVALYFDGEKRFGGFVKRVLQSAVPGQPFRTVITVEMVGYGNLLDRLIAGKLYTLPIGGVVAIILYGLWYDHLRALGVTYNYGAGPSELILPILFHYKYLRDCCQMMLDQTPGWAIWIDNNKELHLAQTNGTGEAAPFELSRTGLDPTVWERTKSGDMLTFIDDNGPFRNREYYLPRSELQSLWPDLAFGDGVQAQFITTYNLTSAPVVTVDGIPQQVYEFSAGGSGTCYWQDGGTGIFFLSAPANGAVISIKYKSPFQIAAKAENADSIAAIGPYDHVTQGQDDVTDWDTANQLAQARLDLYGPDGDAAVSIQFSYNSAQQPAWLEPGMLMTVNWDNPDVSGVFTVRRVSSELYGGTLWRHQVTLSKGPTDTTGVSDSRALMQSALRRSNEKVPTLATLEIGISGEDLDTDPEHLKNTFRFNGSGVLASWDARMASDPPVGSSLILRLKKNGVSIFQAESPFTGAYEITIPDGSTAEQSGYLFSQDNLPYADGDVLTAELLQVGSTTPGKFLLVHLHLKPSLAPAG